MKDQTRLLVSTKSYRLTQAEKNRAEENDSIYLEPSAEK